MVRVSYVLIPPGYENLLYKGLRPGDRFVFPRFNYKNRYINYPKRQKLLQRTLLPTVAMLWNDLSAPEKTAWVEAGAEVPTSGYRIFVQDTCERIRLSLSGLATPSTYHQTFVGLLHVESPATGLLLIQPHPNTYWTRHKVRGTKSQYTMTQIDEPFALPLTIGISHKTDLTSAGANPKARFFARVRSSYQGRDIFTDLEIVFPLSGGWARDEITLSEVLGVPIAYDLYMELQDVAGDLWVDNVKSWHTAQNWARDPACNNIKQSFTSAFYLVPKAWAADELETGADYGSIYVDD